MNNRLERFLTKYQTRSVDPSYLEMYEHMATAGRALAWLHAGIDAELNFMNYKARDGQGGHFNAENSRNLIELIYEMRELDRALKKSGKSLVVAPGYQQTLAGCSEWLVQSGGSSIPEGFTPVEIESYEPVFWLGDSAIPLQTHTNVELEYVGEGAFAVVHKFTDPNYGIAFARKSLKGTASGREAERFRREFEIMNSLRFPYLLPVYKYESSQQYYTMEFCENTLSGYISRQSAAGNRFDNGTRRRIALQVLYGLNYIHNRGLFHRDLSLTNILVREYDGAAATVRLSDFGLARPKGSEFTRTESEIRGTIVDPALQSFKTFSAVNDIYAVGHILSFIFSGERHLISDGSQIGELVQKCSNSNPSLRYQRVIDLVWELEELRL